MKVSKEDFVKIWMKSQKVSEVSAKTGLSESTCKRYAWQFRKNGVSLKKLDEGKKKTDWKALSNLAAELASD